MAKLEFIDHGVIQEPGQRSSLRVGRQVGRSSSPGRVTNFLHVVLTGSGAHLASYPMGTGRSFPGGKAAGA
jgi:hypothetical protein